MSDANWDITSRDIPGETISKKEASTFFESLRCHFIKYLLLPSVAREVKFVLKMNEVPPVVNSLAAGEVLYTSEHVKDSKLMKYRDKLFGNQEMLMHLLKTGEIILGELDSYSNEDLLKLCHKLKFENLSRYGAFNYPTMQGPSFDHLWPNSLLLQFPIGWLEIPAGLTYPELFTKLFYELWGNFCLKLEKKSLTLYLLCKICGKRISIPLQ